MCMVCADSHTWRDHKDTCWGLQTCYSGHILEGVGVGITFTAINQQKWDILTHFSWRGYLPDTLWQIRTYLLEPLRQIRTETSFIPNKLQNTDMQAGIWSGSMAHKHPPPTQLWSSHLCQRVNYDYNNCRSKNLFNMSRNMGMLPVFLDNAL